MGTRVLNFDNVGPIGELHGMVRELNNVLLLFLMWKIKQTWVHAALYSIVYC